jgi:hypothetical protein
MILILIKQFKYLRQPEKVITLHHPKHVIRYEVAKERKPEPKSILIHPYYDAYPLDTSVYDNQRINDTCSRMGNIETLVPL